MSSKEILSARGGGRVPGQAAPLDRPRWGTVQAGSGRLGYLAVLVACAFLGPVFPWSGLDLSWFADFAWYLPFDFLPLLNRLQATYLSST